MDTCLCEYADGMCTYRFREKIKNTYIEKEAKTPIKSSSVK